MDIQDVGNKISIAYLRISTVILSKIGSTGGTHCDDPYTKALET